MKSFRTKKFRAMYADLPPEARAQANTAYQLFRNDPFHTSLQFKQISPSDPTVYSARVGMHYRVIGLRNGETITWIWIGSHAEYDRFKKSFR